MNKMRIAVDLDGVIFDTERNFRVLCEIYDIDNHEQYNVLNNNLLRFQDRYNWSKEECEKFYSDNVFKIEEISNFIPGAIKVLNLLKNMGHRLYIISARGIFSDKQIEISKLRLKENNLDIFEKYIFKTQNKAKFIKKYNIDIMIDDNLDVCNSLKNICKVLYLKDAPNTENKDKKITTVYNWGEIYRYIKNRGDSNEN